MSDPFIVPVIDPSWDMSVKEEDPDLNLTCMYLVSEQLLTFEEFVRQHFCHFSQFFAGGQ